MRLNLHTTINFETSWKRKVIKRDGDKLGFPVFPLEWKTEEGISSGYRKGSSLKPL
jgi:hypothetical protein